LTKETIKKRNKERFWRSQRATYRIRQYCFPAANSTWCLHSLRRDASCQCVLCQDPETTSRRTAWRPRCQM